MSDSIKNDSKHTEGSQSSLRGCDKQSLTYDPDRRHRAERTRQIEHKSRLFGMIEIVSQISLGYSEASVEIFIKIATRYYYRG